MKYWILTSKYDFIPSVIRREDGLWIPMDINNVNYRKYLEWVEEGNVAEEWNPEVNNNG